MASPHSDETKVAILAELATGASVNATAKKFGVGRTTIAAWRDAADLPKPTSAGQQKRQELGEQLYGYLQDSLAALRAQLALFADPAWLQKQPAGDLAILHGIVADKTARLLAAVRLDDSGGEQRDERRLAD